MAIWASPATLGEIAAISRNTSSEYFGITFTGIGEDWLEALLPVDERTRDADGDLHEGAVAILAETLGSVGATLCIDAKRQACLGQVLHVQCPKRVSGGPLIGRAVPLSIGTDNHLWEVKVRDGAGVLVCIAQLTVAVIDRAQ